MAVQPARRAYAPYPLESGVERGVFRSPTILSPRDTSEPEEESLRGRGGGRGRGARAAPAADRGRGAGGDGGDADVHRHQCPVSGDGVAEGAASGETRMGGGRSSDRCSDRGAVAAPPLPECRLRRARQARGKAWWRGEARRRWRAGETERRRRRRQRARGARGGGAEARPRRSTRAGAWRGWAEGGGGFLARTGCELERSCSSRRVRALEALSAAVARHGLTCGASFTMTGRTTPQAPSQPHDSPHELTTTLTAPPSRT